MCSRPKFLAFCFAIIMSGRLYGVQIDLTTVALGLISPKYPIASAIGHYGSDGTYTLQGNGHGFYWGWDRGAFAYTQVSSSVDFTFTARIKEDPTGCVSGQWGIGVREGLVGNERTISARYDEYVGNACITWFYRFAPGDGSSEFCADGQKYTCFKEGKETELKTRTGVWLRIKCIARKYSIFASKDGISWTQMGAEQTMILAAQNVYVGLIFSCGNQGTPSSQARFDNISLVTGTTATKQSFAQTTALPMRLNYLKRGLFSLTVPATLKTLNGLKLDIYTISGKRVVCVMAESDGDKIAFRLPGSLSPGMYRISLRTGTGEFVQQTLTIFAR